MFTTTINNAAVINAIKGNAIAERCLGAVNFVLSSLNVKEDNEFNSVIDIDDDITMNVETVNNGFYVELVFSFSVNGHWTENVPENYGNILAFCEAMVNANTGARWTDHICGGAPVKAIERWQYRVELCVAPDCIEF